MSSPQSDPTQRWPRLAAWLAQTRARMHRVPPGLRSLLGLMLIVGGLFGFLPILGFWMIPLGLVFIALDIAALVRLLRPATNSTDQADGKKPNP